MGAFPLTPPLELYLDDPTATLRAGRLLGLVLAGGDLVALCGPLGAGKTHLVRGLAMGLSVPPDIDVVSPTFVLATQYAGRLLLHHLDVYRLAKFSDLESLGFDELREDSQAVVVVEWADRFSGLLAACTWRIDLAHSENGRVARVAAADATRLAELARLLQLPNSPY